MASPRAAWMPSTPFSIQQTQYSEASVFFPLGEMFLHLLLHATILWRLGITMTEFYPHDCNGGLTPRRHRKTLS